MLARGSSAVSLPPCPHPMPRLRSWTLTGTASETPVTFVPPWPRFRTSTRTRTLWGTRGVRACISLRCTIPHDYAACSGRVLGPLLPGRGCHVERRVLVWLGVTLARGLGTPARPSLWLGGHVQGVKLTRVDNGVVDLDLCSAVLLLPPRRQLPHGVQPNPGTATARCKVGVCGASGQCNALPSRVAPPLAWLWPALSWLQADLNINGIGDACEQPRVLSEAETL